MASLGHPSAAPDMEAEAAREELTGRTFASSPLESEPGRRMAAGRRHRGPRTVVLVVVLAAALAVATFWAGTQVHTQPVAIPHRVIEPISTVPIEHRRLVDFIDAGGEVVRPNGRGVSPLPPDVPAGTQPLITALPARVGQVLHDGSQIAEVAGRPVFVFEGAIPMYRPLSTGDTGSDVAQLQAALVRAGLPVADPSGHFGPATAAALTALFLQHGYRIEDSAPPGTDASAAPGGASSGGASSDGASAAPHRLTVPASSIVYVPQLPATVTSLSARVGARMPGSLLSLSTGHPVVRVDMSPAQALSVPRGAKASIEVAGRARSGQVVGRRRATGSEGRSALIVQPTEPLEGSVDRQVTVRIVKASTPHAAWVVPFSAVGTASDGSSFVEIVRGERRLRIPVTLGMTARGYVAVTPLHGARFAAGEVVAADA
jgi:membrane fusion protein, multidrug efflux system